MARAKQGKRRTRERAKERGLTIACIVAIGLCAVLFVARRSAGVDTVTAFADAFTISGGAVSAPLLLAWLFSGEGADGLAYAAWRGAQGIFPFIKGEANYSAYKRRRRESRAEKRWDYAPLKVGGVFFLAGVVFAFVAGLR